MTSHDDGTQRSTEQARAVIEITGRVQGVFFRKEAERKTTELGITGFAENLSSGAVCIVAEGTRHAIEKLIAWCRKGSDLASVANVNVQWQPATKTFIDFTIR